MGIPRVIVWDLDGTLGNFDPLEKNWTSNSAITVATRPGLAKALQALGRAGFVHSLLTLATPAYAAVALRGTGLHEHIARVEGQGQRKKGDVAGLATAFGITATEAPARMLFVGDRMIFDEPDHPEVVFHLEPFALTRPAHELERLVLRLREAGAGSIREGFRALGTGGRKKWYHVRRQASLPAGRPAQRHVRGLGSLLLFERRGECPVIGYERAPAPAAAAEEHCFIPAVVRGKDGAEACASTGRAADDSPGPGAAPG
jgi:hypothetical protein